MTKRKKNASKKNEENRKKSTNFWLQYSDEEEVVCLTQEEKKEKKMPTGQPKIDQILGKVDGPIRIPVAPLDIKRPMQPRIDRIFQRQVVSAPLPVTPVATKQYKSCIGKSSGAPTKLATSTVASSSRTSSSAPCGMDMSELHPLLSTVPDRRILAPTKSKKEKEKSSCLGVVTSDVASTLPPTTSYPADKLPVHHVTICLNMFIKILEQIRNKSYTTGCTLLNPVQQQSVTNTNCGIIPTTCKEVAQMLFFTKEWMNLPMYDRCVTPSDDRVDSLVKRGEEEGVNLNEYLKPRFVRNTESTFGWRVMKEGPEDHQTYKQIHAIASPCDCGFYQSMADPDTGYNQPLLQSTSYTTLQKQEEEEPILVVDDNHPDSGTGCTQRMVRCAVKENTTSVVNVVPDNNATDHIILQRKEEMDHWEIPDSDEEEEDEEEDEEGNEENYEVDTENTEEGNKIFQDVEAIHAYCHEIIVERHTRHQIWTETHSEFKKRTRKQHEYLKKKNPKTHSWSRYSTEGHIHNETYKLQFKFNEFQGMPTTQEMKQKLFSLGCPLVPQNVQQIGFVGYWSWTFLNGKKMYDTANYDVHMRHSSKHTKIPLAEGYEGQQFVYVFREATKVTDVDVHEWRGTAADLHAPTPTNVIRNSSAPVQNATVVTTGRFRRLWLKNQVPPVCRKVHKQIKGKRPPSGFLKPALVKLQKILRVTYDDMLRKDSPVVQSFLYSNKYFTYVIDGIECKGMGKKGNLVVKGVKDKKIFCRELHCWQRALVLNSGLCDRHGSKRHSIYVIYDTANQQHTFSVISKWNRQNSRTHVEDPDATVSYHKLVKKYRERRIAEGFQPKWKIVRRWDNLTTEQLRTKVSTIQFILCVVFSLQNWRANRNLITLLQNFLYIRNVDLEIAKASLMRSGIYIGSGDKSPLSTLTWFPPFNENSRVYTDDALVYLRFGVPGELYPGKHLVKEYDNNSTQFIRRGHNKQYNGIPLMKVSNSNVNSRELIAKREGIAHLVVALAQMLGATIDGVPVKIDFSQMVCNTDWNQSDMEWALDVFGFITGFVLKCEITPLDPTNLCSLSFL